ncbi:hypothetical protein NDN08_001085 [Rhodosorus marinus]|uniref:Uncharacterized protein n=1 Tax=Rhodosorus marinus TaxID=101924 RepID=A0AAV8UTZ6_9RHOD|nr:hypothetical protein NDN08_001085 [Rhodosorus marinus]
MRTLPISYVEFQETHVRRNRCRSRPGEILKAIPSLSALMQYDTLRVFKLGESSYSNSNVERPFTNSSTSS